MRHGVKGLLNSSLYMRPPTSSGLFRQLVRYLLRDLVRSLALLQDSEYAYVEAEGELALSERIDLPQGTLDLLILKTLALEPQHGWAISERIQQISSDVLQVQQGSLYPALHRLERRGWIRATWGISDNNRRAKYYELTRSGRKQLEVESDSWRKLSAAVGQVLDRA